MRILLVCLSIAAISCRDPVASVPSLQVRTSASVYSRAPGAADVHFTVTNLGTEPVLVSRCGDRLTAALDRREGLRWVQYSGDYCLAIYAMGPISVQPGETRVQVRGILDGGLYRIRLGTYPNPTSEPRWVITSNVFEIR